MGARDRPRRAQDATILLPVGGLRMIRNLCTLSGDKLMLVVGDKGYNHESDLLVVRDPHVAVHGSFSFMVNMHAIRYAAARAHVRACHGWRTGLMAHVRRLYFERREGFSVASPYKDGFKVPVCCVCGPPACAHLPRTVWRICGGRRQRHFPQGACTPCMQRAHATR